MAFLRKTPVFIFLSAFFLSSMWGGGASARLIFSSEDAEFQPNGAFVLDRNDDFNQVNLKFGETLDAQIQYDKIVDDFVINRDLDLGGFQLQNTRLENLASAPTCDGTSVGRVYFDTTSGSPYACDGSTWFQLDAGAASFLDEDDMISDDATQGATQQSIKAYVDAFLPREMSALSDGKYVIQKESGVISFREILQEYPGGDSLFGGPNQVEGLNATQSYRTEISIAWNDPGVAPGDPNPINDYAIQFRLNGDTVWTDVVDGVSTNTSYTFTGLTAATTYDFRVRATNGNFGPWSVVAIGETKPDDPFFDPGFRAMNVGGSVASAVTAFEDTTAITLNGTPLTTLNKGTTFSFTASQYDIIEADKPIFVAGNNNNNNFVWSLPLWAAKNFALNSTRADPQELYVYAWQDATVEIQNGAGAIIDTVSLLAGQNHNFSWNSAGQTQHLISDGSIMAFMTSATSDPKPVLPGASQIIGFPSSSMSLSSQSDSNNYTGLHSNGVNTSNTLDKTTLATITPQGTSSLYQTESLLITADNKIMGASYADSNGSAAAPFLPTDLMRTRYAINVDSDWVAFASTESGTINVLDSSDNVLQTLTLSGGGGVGVPYRVRRGITTAGTRFVSTVPVAGWYEPNTNIDAGNDDETVLFGFD